MTKRKKKRISEKMRRYNLSLQRPQEEFRRRVIEWERMRKEREPEERRKERRRKWKKWLGLADFTEYDGPFPIFICAVFFLVIFLSGISLCVLGLFKGNHTIFRHANFIGCLSADKIKMPVRKYFCFNIPVYRNMAEEPSCRSPYHEEYIQTSVSGNSEGLCRSTYSFLSERR